MTPADALAPQPPPTPGYGDVWAELIPTLPEILRPYAVERRRQGIERYGVPLQHGNGRDPLLDAFQEDLDRIAYLRQHHVAMQVRLSLEIGSGCSIIVRGWWAVRVWQAAEMLRLAIKAAESTAREIAEIAGGVK